MMLFGKFLMFANGLAIKFQDLMASRTTIVLARAIVAALLIAWRVICVAFLRIGGSDQISLTCHRLTVT
jgi:hypothetical protein